jgi:hypothetical protein
MTDFPPPWRAEAILESLGAKPEFRETLIGDLAEEFASRAERDGPAAARRWYYREAVRVTPHLLRSASRELSLAEIGRTANVLALSYLCAVTIEVFIGLTVWAVLRATGVSQNPFVHVWKAPMLPAVILGLCLFAGCQGMLTGFLAACFDRRAPVLTALMLGVVWSCILIVASMNVSVADRPPVWYPTTFVICLVCATTAGGIVRVWTSHASPGRATSA